MFTLPANPPESFGRIPSRHLPVSADVNEMWPCFVKVKSSQYVPDEPRIIDVWEAFNAKGECGYFRTDFGAIDFMVEGSVCGIKHLWGICAGEKTYILRDNTAIDLDCDLAKKADMTRAAALAKLTDEEIKVLGLK